MGQHKQLRDITTEIPSLIYSWRAEEFPGTLQLSDSPSYSLNALRPSKFNDFPLLLSFCRQLRAVGGTECSKVSTLDK
jgi:hypothetical protein